MLLYQTAKYIACFDDEQGIFSIFCSCFVHKQILVCLSIQRTSGLLCFHVLWRIIVNTCAIILSCFVQNHWSNFVSEHPMIFSMLCKCFATKHLSMPAVHALIVMLYLQFPKRIPCGEVWSLRRSARGKSQPAPCSANQTMSRDMWQKSFAVAGGSKCLNMIYTVS